MLLVGLIEGLALLIQHGGVSHLSRVASYTTVLMLACTSSKATSACLWVCSCTIPTWGSTGRVVCTDDLGFSHSLCNLCLATVADIGHLDTFIEQLAAGRGMELCKGCMLGILAGQWKLQVGVHGVRGQRMGTSCADPGHARLYGRWEPSVCSLD